ncbi:MAG: glycosyltransferase family 39 protein [Candidatus Shapirobacteria bacterium]
MIKTIKIVSVLIIVILAFNLRYKNFYEVPISGSSMDEYSYSWVGFSLIKNGYPVGLSGLPGYKNIARRYVNSDLVLNKVASGPLPLNYPWFDHPPALGLLTGGFAYIKGAQNLEDIRLQVARQPMVILGTLSVLLVFILAYVNFGYMVAIISSAIYAVEPMTVIGSRMIQGENGVIPFMLLSLIFISIYLKSNNFHKLIWSGIFAGISMLFKLSGVVSVIACLVLILLLDKKKSKLVDAFSLVAVSLSIASLFGIYGLFYDWTTFKNIIFSNASRFYGIGADSIYRLLARTSIVSNKNLPDGWILVGWMSIFSLLGIKNKKKLLIIIPLLAYLIVYIFFGSYLYFWYTLPFLPLLAIASGYVIQKIIIKKQLIKGVFLSIIPLGVGISSIISLSYFQVFALYWRIILPILLVLFFIGEYFKNKKVTSIGQYIIYFCLLTALIANSIFVLKFGINSWYSFSW